MRKRNILLRLAYDGTDFNGYQVQAQGERTVQGVLDMALAKLHGHSVTSVAAGRTDSGVHADSQCVSFYSDRDGIPEEKFTAALNRLLPPDLKVQQSREVPETFHARYSATYRGYRYYVLVSQVPVPKYRNYSWRVRAPLTIDRLNEDSHALVGERDFTTFAAAGQSQESNVRTVYRALFTWEPPFVVFSIEANGFLWKMVRSIVGTMVERESARLRCETVELSVEEILERRKRDLAGVTAPPQGLFLTEVGYDE